MTNDHYTRFKRFQLCRVANVTVLLLVFSVCGVINYDSEAYFDIFMYHLGFAVPSILFHLVSGFRVNKTLSQNYGSCILVSLASLFYLGVMFWTLITYFEMSATKNKVAQEELWFFLFYYLIPGSVISVSFLAIALFYLEEEEVVPDDYLESNVELPILRLHFVRT
ncbi:unnamed protein product [Moneuplotes crassus]|uniref:Uncharacterized protein n=1 Tax=Euplotes crassus TaxID=5936 RepID=A0AAD1XZS2_EUPCR|nr:unnamed protein product [Moneuplotes crassus]